MPDKPRRRKPRQSAQRRQQTSASQPTAIPWFQHLSEPVRPYTSEEFYRREQELGRKHKQKQTAPARAAKNAGAEKQKKKKLAIVREVIRVSKPGTAVKHVLKRVNDRLSKIGLETISSRSAFYRWRNQAIKKDSHL